MRQCTAVKDAFSAVDEAHRMSVLARSVNVQGVLGNRVSLFARKQSSLSLRARYGCAHGAPGARATRPTPAPPARARPRRCPPPPACTARPAPAPRPPTTRRARPATYAPPQLRVVGAQPCGAVVWRWLWKCMPRCACAAETTELTRSAERVSLADSFHGRF